MGETDDIFADILKGTINYDEMKTKLEQKIKALNERTQDANESDEQSSSSLQKNTESNKPTNESSSHKKNKKPSANTLNKRTQEVGEPSSIIRSNKRTQEVDVPSVSYLTGRKNFTGVGGYTSIPWSKERPATNYGTVIQEPIIQQQTYVESTFDTWGGKDETCRGAVGYIGGDRNLKKSVQKYERQLPLYNKKNKHNTMQSQDKKVELKNRMWNMVCNTLPTHLQQDERKSEIWGI